MTGENPVTGRTVRRLLVALAWCAAGFVAAAPGHAATLRPGDIVQAERASGISAMAGLVVLLDPATLDTTFVSYGPLVRTPFAVAVDWIGRILVADWNSGVVTVDAAGGAQSVLASPADLGGNPAGICVAPQGDLFVSVRGSSPGVVRVASNGSSVTPVTLGGLISYPGGLTMGPDGAIYVTEGGLPADNGGTYPPGYTGHGSIVRVDATSGAQTRVAADSLFVTPHDIAFVAADEVWTLQGGYVAGREGCFIRTRLGDGSSALAYEVQYCRSLGIAAVPGGAIYVSDCQTIGPDCASPFTQRLPGGPTLAWFAGPMAVVPPGAVPVLHRSWGALKTIYR